MQQFDARAVMAARIAQEWQAEELRLPSVEAAAERAASPVPPPHASTPLQPSNSSVSTSFTAPRIMAGEQPFVRIATMMITGARMSVAGYTRRATCLRIPRAPRAHTPLALTAAAL